MTRLTEWDEVMPSRSVCPAPYFSTVTTAKTHHKAQAFRLCRALVWKAPLQEFDGVVPVAPKHD